MDQQIVPGRRTPGKAVMIVLAIVSLVLLFTGNIGSFFTYEIGSLLPRLTMPSATAILSKIITSSPVVVFLVYTAAFFGKGKAEAMVHVFLGLTALIFIYLFFSDLVTIFSINLDYMDVKSKITYILQWTIDLLLIVASAVFFTFAAIFGRKKRVFIIIASAVSIACAVYDLFTAFSLISYFIGKRFFLYVVTVPFGILGSAAFYAALLIFGIYCNKAG